MSRTAHVDDEPEDDNVLSLSLADYTVACICPLGVECAAVEAMLDEIHDPLPTGRDRNAYTFGRLGPHNIIVAVMPETGNNTAATTATQLLNDFPSFRFGLLVGIGGGVPGSKESGNDVRLGDVVVSHATGTFGGVVQYDLGKKLFNGSFQRTGHLNKPPEVLSASAKRLQASHYRSPSKMTSYLAEMTGRFPKMQELFQHPGLDQDELFCSDYAHQGGSSCEECDREQTVPRPPRRDIDPRIHYGTIGSANMVLKDAVTRDQLKRDTGALCVEMEAAGLMDTFPCLVIRGICDYADSHKNKQWQPYAAATAAAYMKELLMMIPLQQVKQTAAARESTKAGAIHVQTAGR
ncbi:pfs domain-containing protein [Aspergillus crustosus]